MTVLSLILPEINKPDSTEDPKINTALTTIQNWANGNIDTTNVKDESLTGKDLGPETVRALSTSAYTTATPASGAEVEPSASRPAFVTVYTNEATSLKNVTVGGVVVMLEATASSAVSFITFPGEKYKVTTTNGTAYHSSTRLL